MLGRRHLKIAVIIRLRLLQVKLESLKSLIRFKAIIMEDSQQPTEQVEPNTMNKSSDHESANNQYHLINTILTTT
jgi:hypothetical protein